MTPDAIALAAGKPVSANLRSVVAGLEAAGDAAGLDRPHRLAHYLGQLMHESMGFHYDREIASGAAYEGRRDLGNTEPGDGRRFKGRGPLQITGRANYRAFRDWCRLNVSAAAPDFTETPDAINTDPWEGLGPIWYWQTRSLGALADANLIETITRRINGGLNGYKDRRRYYARTALVLLGRAPDDVRGFQQASGLTVDGISGAMTEATLHSALCRLPAASWSRVEPEPLPVDAELRFAALEAAVLAVQADLADIKRRVGADNRRVA